uniref:CD28 molecule n=1 Tax=Takifugu rubripes TaxID=31033 RepID=H2T9I9_TAKRU
MLEANEAIWLYSFRDKKSIGGYENANRKNRLNTVCVPVGGNVNVPCPNSSAEDIKFSLFKDGECVHHHTQISGATTPNQNTSTNPVGVEYPSANSPNFTITGVNASSHGIYTCEVTEMFPPPLMTLYSDLRILVLIEGHQCSAKDKNPTIRENQTCGCGWMWIFALVIGSYSVTVTIGAIIIWVKWRREDSQSDYINTISKTTRYNKRKLHIPTMHYFYAPN